MKKNWGYILIGVLSVVILLKYFGIFDRFHKSTLVNSDVNHTSKGYNKGKGKEKESDEFIESKTFNGGRKGYVFKTGDKGTGYYID